MPHVYLAIVYRQTPLWKENGQEKAIQIKNKRAVGLLLGNKM